MPTKQEPQRTRGPQLEPHQIVYVTPTRETTFS